MVHFKIIRRRSNQKKDGTAPLVLRISKDYKVSYLFLGQYVLERDWNPIRGEVKATHPYHIRLNNFLMKKIIKANEMSFKLGDQVSAKVLKERIKGDRRQYSKTFFELAAERIQRKYDEQVFSVAKAELSIILNVEEFLNLKKSIPKKEVIKNIDKRRRERIGLTVKGELTFEDFINHFKNDNRLPFRQINQSFLKRFKTFCAAYLNQKKRTTTNQLIFIRTLFNVAIKEGLVSQEYYPFGGDKEKIRINSGNKVGLNKEEVKRIEDLELEEGSFIWHTRNIWLIAFYFAGMRISDVLRMRWSDYRGDRLYYIMQKNSKPLNLKIPGKANEILKKYKKYRRFQDDFVFPLIHVADINDKEDIYRKIKSSTKRLNDYLKVIAKKGDITKTLSNHIARHSFGNIAGDKIHPLMLQKLYRHSNLKTTLNYQANFIHKEADDALDSVIGF